MTALASRSANLYNPPVKNPRPFDYPRGARTDATGRLTHDIEGRPLVADRVVGRRVVGGEDEAFPASQLDALAAATTGRASEVIPQAALGRDLGRARFHRHTREPLGIELSAILTPKQAPPVLGHELGHVIDEMAGQIPTAGLNAELRQVYNTINTGRERTRNLTGPQHLGYRGMSPGEKEKLRTRLREQVPVAADGRVVYEAFANAVKGRVRG